MTKRRTKKRSTRTTIAISRKQFGIALLVIWWLYFFALFFADGSPILEVANKVFSVILGEQWLSVFFLLCVLAGVGVLLKQGMIGTTIKQWILATILVSAILNFPLLAEGGKQLLNMKECLAHGWYMSWPVLWLLQRVFGDANTGASKIIIIVMAAALVVRIFRAWNMKLPNLSSFSVKRDNAIPSLKTSKKRANDDRDEEEETEEVYHTTKWNKSWNEANGSMISLLKTGLKKKVEEKLKEKEPKKIITFPKDKPTYPISLLDWSGSNSFVTDDSYLVAKAKALQDKLAEFSIPVEIKWYNVWPSVVQIKIAPAQGIKISSIESYQKDLALALKTKSLRILAPIPGTDVVGIEIPNPQSHLVRVRQIMENAGFADAVNRNLTNLVLWIGIDGKLVRKPLENMPHLLVAWATWSGKSVAINTFILSLMYQNSPSEMKFLMVDPKQVELGMYDGIPYLLAPVETAPEKALKILKWAVNEMEKRYTLLKSMRVKKLTEYNEKVPSKDLVPRIIIIIDELADLMMNRNTKKDTELCITRIAQKARAVWIHLIVATQRPSVDVVTGLIKANIPTRIAFSVVSQIDSRTILDVKWAEELLGKWDMLYMDPANNGTIRMQGPLVTTEEIDDVVVAIKKKYMTGIKEEDIYDPELMNILSAKNVWSGMAGWWYWFSWDGNDEELIEQAIEIIRQTHKASATLLQRKLWVWFARAARIMDQLEEQWVVGPQDGAKPRDIYI